jgi:hypothetical protein
MGIDPEYEHAKDVKRRHAQSLMSRERVVGVGLSRRQPRDTDESRWVIVVYVSKKIPGHQIDPADLIPREIEGVRTDVVETGQPIPFAP